MNSQRYNKRLFWSCIIALTILSLLYLSTEELLSKYPFAINLAISELKQIKQSILKDKNNLPLHIMFIFVDHFDIDSDNDMKNWLLRYPLLASRHRDSDGKHPQHTWFMKFGDNVSKEKKTEWLIQLADLCYRGYGEVELHLHHENDTGESLAKKLREYIQLSNLTGALITTEEKPKRTYGFIHGLWSLDNSRGDEYCGVNNELIVLNQTGCYADFTHPSWGKMHPKKINSIYYAKDDPLKPKSYDTGEDVRVGGSKTGDLMIFLGPSSINFSNLFDPKRELYDHGNIDHVDIPTKKRVDKWIGCNIHVKGQPNWVFVKVFTHGATDESFDTLFGKPLDDMYSYLEEKYNDGKRYILHYVTAREAYNIVKAAEDGKTGNPNQYRDYLIKPYANKKIKSNLPYRLESYAPNFVNLKILENTLPVNLEFKELPLEKVNGMISDLKFEYNKEEQMQINLSGNGNVEFKVAVPLVHFKLINANIVKIIKKENHQEVTISTQLTPLIPKEITIRYLNKEINRD